MIQFEAQVAEVKADNAVKLAGGAPVNWLFATEKYVKFLRTSPADQQT